MALALLAQGAWADGRRAPEPLAEPLAAGAFLAARAALGAHDFPAAAPFLADALRADPLNPRLLDAAATAALAQGDLAAALPFAERLEAGNGAGGAPSLGGRLARLADLAGREDWPGLLALAEAGRGPSPLLDGLARGWAELGQGRRERALEAFDRVAAEPGLRGFGLTHKALALAALGDLAGAEAILASEGVPQTRRGLMARATALAGLGRGEEALLLLEGAFGPAPDAAVAALRDRIRAGDAPGPTVADAREGLAEALLGVAEALSGDGDAAASLLHARAALLVDPARAEAAVVAAERLDVLGQAGLALDAFALVAPSDPAIVLAEVGRAATLRRSGGAAAAVDALLSLAAAHPGRPEVEGALADALRAEGRFAEAARAYGRAIDLRQGERGDALWWDHYARAIARDAAGDWPGAEADLRRALELRPGHAPVLNRLGYSLVERGERLDEALGFLEDAAALEPESGAVVDSLGWALLALGRHAEAVEALERAASLDPADAVINDHLGDAYWIVGRTREARVQWARALRLGPGPAEAEALRRKLAEGLPAPEAAAGSAPAAADHAGTPGGGQGG